jgi:TRAP-type mannitol/chloroaromatic compound transport system permease small subunit
MGKVISFLFIPLTLLVVADVFTRYALNKPWFYMDVNVQLAGLIVLMGAGYGLIHGSHIGVDALVIKWPPRRKAILDLILFVPFIASLGALLWKAVDGACGSIKILERVTSALALPIYPYKIMMVIGILLLFLQGIVALLRCITIISHSPRGKV